MLKPSWLPQTWRLLHPLNLNNLSHWVPLQIHINTKFFYGSRWRLYLPQVRIVEPIFGCFLQSKFTPKYESRCSYLSRYIYLKSALLSRWLGGSWAGAAGARNSPSAPMLSETWEIFSGQSGIDLIENNLSHWLKVFIKLKFLYAMKWRYFFPNKVSIFKRMLCKLSHKKINWYRIQWYKWSR